MIFALPDSYIGSIDNVVLPENGLSVTITCPVLTSVHSVSWFMIENDASTVNVFNGIDYDINTPGRYYCQATEQRGIYRSNTFTAYRVGKDYDSYIAICDYVQKSGLLIKSV